MYSFPIICVCSPNQQPHRPSVHQPPQPSDVRSTDQPKTNLPTYPKNTKLMRLVSFLIFPTVVRSLVSLCCVMHRTPYLGSRSASLHHHHQHDHEHLHHNINSSNFNYNIYRIYNIYTIRTQPSSFDHHRTRHAEHTHSLYVCCFTTAIHTRGTRRRRRARGDWRRTAAAAAPEAVARQRGAHRARIHAARVRVRSAAVSINGNGHAGRSSSGFWFLRHAYRMHK